MSRVRKLRSSISGMAMLCAVVPLVLGQNVDTAGAQCNYEITALIDGPDCPPFGKAPIIATAINDHGVVVGHFNPCLIGPAQPFMWSAETGFVAIPLPPGVPDATPADINNHNEIVGTMNHTGPGGDRAFHYKDGVWTELELLPPFPQTMAFSLNDASEIVGAAFDGLSVEPFRAVVWKRGEISPLQLPVGPNSAARDIADTGTIVGWMGDDPSTKSTGFIVNGSITSILRPRMSQTVVPQAVNNLDVVTGWSFFPRSNELRSWIHRDGRLTDLGTLQGLSRCFAADVNDMNHIVGHCASVTGGTRIAFLWQHDQMFDLNLLLDQPPDFVCLQDCTRHQRHR